MYLLTSNIDHTDIQINSWDYWVVRLWTKYYTGKLLTNGWPLGCIDEISHTEGNYDREKYQLYKQVHENILVHN